MQKTFLKILSMNLALTMTASLVARAQDGDADVRQEERFHRIYKKYNEQPTPEEAWEKVLSGRKAETYSVQSKDTLWDISHTLFGDSNYWPKVWSFNTDNIQNPHEINPKQAIKFYPGTMAEAPTVGLADKNAPAEDLPDEVIEKNEAGQLESVKIPPPRRKSRPLVKTLPKSLPLYRMGGVNKPPVDFEVSGAQVKYAAAPKYLSFWASESPTESIGEVVDMEEPDERTVGDTEMLFVRVSNAAQKRFLVVKDDVTVTDKSDLLAPKATVVEVQGEIELMERVNDGENLYRAVVRQAIQPIDIGSKLMPGTLKTFDSTPTPITTSVQAKIIGGEYQRFEQRMFGTDNVIFLNAGAKEGLQENSTLQIFLNERLRKPNTKAIANDRVIGQVKIIKLSDHFATGYIIDSTAEIWTGDYAGGSVKAKPSEAALSDDSSAFDSAHPAPNVDTTNDPDFNLDGPDNNAAPSAAPPADDDLQL